jgi:hypothetical protein
MKRHVIRTISLAVALVLSLIINTSASAAQLKENQYLSSYNATIFADGGGYVTVEYAVFATATADELGVTQLIIQRKTGSTWANVRTFTRNTNPALIGTSCPSYMGSITYSGTSGQQYRAVLTMYAKIGSGSSSVTFTTNTVTA